MVVLLVAAFVLFVAAVVLLFPIVKRSAAKVVRYPLIVDKYPLNVVSSADKFVFTYVFRFPRYVLNVVK